MVLAVPVAPADWTLRLAGEADEFIALDTPSDFAGVGQFYRDFSQTTDREVTAVSGPSRRLHASSPTP